MNSREKVELSDICDQLQDLLQSSQLDEGEKRDLAIEILEILYGDE